MDVEVDRMSDRAPVVVLATAATHVRLARESRISALTGLAVHGTGRSSGSPFLRCAWNELEPDDSLRDDADRSREESRLGSLVAQLTRSDASPVVVHTVNAPGELREFVRIVERTLAVVARHADFASLDNASWTLVLVAECELSAEDLAALDSLKALHFIDGRSTQAFAACYLMTRQVGSARVGGAIFARDIWPLAVGRLLLHHYLVGKRRRDGAWLRTWDTRMISLVPDDPRFEQFLLSKANKALSVSQFGASMFEERQRPVEGARYEARKSGIVKLSSEHVPRSATDSESEDNGMYRGDDGGDVPSFLESSGTTGSQQYASRGDRSNKGWRGRFENRSARFRKDRDRRHTAPFGSGDGGGEDAKAPAGVVRTAWSDVRRLRWNLVWYSGAQAIEAFPIGKLLRSQELKWRSLLDFENFLRRAARQVEKSSLQQDEARRAFVSIWARLVISVSVSLFVGFALAAIVASLSGSSVQAVVLGGSAAAAGSLCATAFLMLTEKARGDAGARFLSDQLKELEEGISSSLGLRLDMLAGADELRCKMIWMSTSARVRRLAARAHTISKAAIDKALASRREMLDEMLPDRRASVERYLSASTESAHSNLGDVGQLVVRLEAECQNPESVLSEALKRSFRDMEVTWSHIVSECDVHLQGDLPASVMFDSVFSAACEARRRVETGISETLRDFGDEREMRGQVEAFLESASQEHLLSVRTGAYAQGEGMETPPMCWHALQDEGSVEGQLHGAPELVSLVAALALIHREQGVEAEFEGVVRFRVLREGRPR
jgi:hypothetical protein